MARIRTIKPDFWTDEKIVELSFEARLFFIGSWNFADDNGNLQRSPKKLKMQIFPADSIDCEPLIQSLIAHGLLTEYSVSGETFLHVKGFSDHQVINRPSKSRLPLPPESMSTSVPLTEDSLTEGKGREGKGKEEEESIVVVEPAQQDPDDFTPKDAAQWLAHFKRKHGFEADAHSIHDRKKYFPVFAAWSNAGLTVGFVDAAVAAAHARSSEAISNLPLYVDRLMASEQSARASPNRSYHDERADVIAELTGANRRAREQNTPETFDVHAKRIG